MPERGIEVARIGGGYCIVCGEPRTVGHLRVKGHDKEVPACAECLAGLAKQVRAAEKPNGTGQAILEATRTDETRRHREEADGSTAMRG